MNIQDLLIKHEDIKLKPYRDTKGKLTIGVGRNLDDKGISLDEAIYMMNADIREVKDYLSKYPWFVGLNDARKDAVMDMCFNLGINGLLKFVNFIKALSENKFAEAKIAMLDSVWSTQVGKRAHELAYMIENGEYPR